MTDTNTPEGHWGPSPPWPPGAGNNCRREGWQSYFAREPREACPLPPSRKDLCAGYREGWDAAQAANTPPDPTEPPFAAAQRGALPGQLRETKSSSEPALSELVETDAPQMDRLFIGAGEYVRWDQAVRSVMALQAKLYAADQSLTALQAQVERQQARIETLEACLRCDDASVRSAWAREAKWKAQVDAMTTALELIADPRDGSTSGDGHARCQQIASQALPKTGGSEP